MTIPHLWRHTAIAVLLGAALALLSPGGALAQRAELVRIPFPQEDGSLTPYTFELGYPLVTLIYDTLTWRDTGGVPRPWLARSIRRGEGGLTVTVELRRGVRWHDGRPLTADDVAFTFGYVARRPHPRFTPQLRDVESVEAVDRDTVVFRLERPSLGFSDQPLADVPILPRHLWEGVGPGGLAPTGLPVGSGPYRLVEHREGELYRFEANRRYFRGEPGARAIEVPIIRRPQATFDALRERRVDAVPVSVPADARGLRGVDVAVAEGTSYVGTVLMLNVARPPFDRLEVRRAVAQALDLGRITRASAGGELRGAAPADRGYLHPDSPWAASSVLHRFRPEAARIAFAELGVPPITVLVPRNDPTRVEAGRQVVLALRRAGASARLRELQPAALARAVGQDGSAPGFEAAIWSAPPLASYDPAFLQALFGDPASTPLNYPGYSSERFERLARAVSSAGTVRARRRAVDRELRLLARDLPVIPLFFGAGAFAYRPAAYDAWEFVRGAGILDKRSFLPRRGRPAAAPPVVDPRDEGEGDDGLSLLPFLLAGGALLALAAAWRLVSGVTARPR